MKVSASLEDYLEVILDLSTESPKVRVTDLANKLNVSKPSVNKAVSILKEQGFIEHEKYGTLQLTDSGKKIAEDVRERHDILKYFLVEVLKVEEDVAEDEACKMEHGLSQETIRKLKNFLKNR
ncbi:MAG: metal-dependent transcriptional regulator [Lachnospirales bacterium]